MPCHHGTVLDCDFFIHRKMTKVYRIKQRSPALTQAQLVKLKQTIDLILGEDALEAPAQTIREAIKAEERRHKKALRDIVNNSRKN